MTAVAAGSLVVGVLVGVAADDLTRRHLRRVNSMLAADAVTARRQRDEWATVAQRPPDARDWVRRADVIRLAHIEERAEAVAAENRDLRRQRDSMTATEQLVFPPHRARTTSIRLGNHLVEWWDDFTDDEKAAIAVVRDALDRIADRRDR